MSKKKDDIEIVYDIFEVQPEACRQPLPPKEINVKQPEYRRILEFDPAPIYERLRYKLNPFTRHNMVNFFEMFPENGNLCACGCGLELTGRRSRWATNTCQKFAIGVWEIFTGRPTFIRHILFIYLGGSICRRCGNDKGHDVDHIIPIKLGGSGCWLSNFQILCNDCHKEKTREDFNWTKSTRKKKEK